MKNQKRDLRILVIGAGVLGCNLAANLYRAGKNITLLARGLWYREIKTKGLTIKNKLSLRSANYPIQVIDRLNIKDRYDVIFVCVQFMQLDDLIPTLRQNPTKNVVFIGNNLKPNHYAELLNHKNVMFGFTLAAGHREKTHVESVDLKNITVGDLKGFASNRFLLQAIFRDTSYRWYYEPNMGDYLLSHAAIVLPAAYACYCTDGDLKKLSRDAKGIHRIIDANIELYTLLAKSGHEILPKKLLNYHSKSYRKKFFLFYRMMSATSFGKICASDHAMSAIPEMEAIAEEMEILIRRSGADVPAYRALQAMQKYIDVK